MAVLQESDRASIWAEYMRAPDPSDEYTLTKNDLRQAVNATDDWIDANAGSYNSAIPQPARSNLNARQKARLLMFVMRRRFEIE